MQGLEWGLGIELRVWGLGFGVRQLWGLSLEFVV